jgi:hypothetical protein
MGAFIHPAVGTPKDPPPTHRWNFYSQVLPSRIRRNSLETKDGASFYPSQKPEGIIRVVPVRVTQLSGKTEGGLRLDNAETGHIRYSFALWLQERTAPVSFSDHASEIP